MSRQCTTCMTEKNKTRLTKDHLRHIHDCPIGTKFILGGRKTGVLLKKTPSRCMVRWESGGEDIVSPYTQVEPIGKGGTVSFTMPASVWDTTRMGDAFPDTATKRQKKGRGEQLTVTCSVEKAEAIAEVLDEMYESRTEVDDSSYQAFHKCAEVAERVRKAIDESGG